MLGSGVAYHSWGEIILTVCHVLNRIPKYRSVMTPCETFKCRQPNTSYFRTCGCLTYVRIPDFKRLNFSNIVYECVYIGYGFDNNYIHIV